MIVFLIDSDSGGVVLHHTTQEPLPELLQWPARPIYVSLGGGGVVCLDRAAGRQFQGGRLGTWNTHRSSFAHDKLFEANTNYIYICQIYIIIIIIYVVLFSASTFSCSAHTVLMKI